jgi:hypothetical protein
MKRAPQVLARILGEDIAPDSMGANYDDFACADCGMVPCKCWKQDETYCEDCDQARPCDCDRADEEEEGEDGA